MAPKPTPITLAHGGGGQLTDELLSRIVLPRLGNPVLGELLDSGILQSNGQRLAVTIDGYVVQPWRFPGGDIGRLSVCGTVNDLSVCGARPLGLALSLILEEGLDREILEQVMESVATTAREAGVSIVTGDTKVVGRGQGDGIYVTTAGVGSVREGCELHPNRVQPGDVLILNGPIADHGLAVMLAREMPHITSAIKSDVAPLNQLIHKLLDHMERTNRLANVAFMRDPTRGGLAGVAADLAARTHLHVILDESAIPVRPETRHAADLLGLDVLEVANEGKVVIVARAAAADEILAVLKDDPLGQDARIIGRVEDRPQDLCELHTTLGGRRILQKPYGEQLPRIC